MESLGSKLSKILLKKMHFKEQMKLSGDEFWDDVEKNKYVKPIVLKPVVFRNLLLETIENEPYKMYRIFPENDDADKLIIFIHGGAFVSTIMPFHFNFLYDILTDLPVQALVPLYPLLPEGKVEDIHERLLEVYESALESGFEPSNIVFMGDSAGGYLSLILAHLAKEKNLSLPGRIILISPLLDFCPPNEEALEIDKRDPFLSMECRTDLLDKLSAGRELENPLVSPRFGNFKGYPEIDIFTGTDDILSIQAKNFYNDKSDEVKINLHVFDDMVHNFPIIPIFEGMKARKKIREIIKSL